MTGPREQTWIAAARGGEQGGFVGVGRVCRERGRGLTAAVVRQAKGQKRISPQETVEENEK